MATDPHARRRGCLVGLGVLFGVIACASLGAAYTAAQGERAATGAVEGAACGVVLGALVGSVLARRS
jgi:purine-cytosine permease-like protein